MSESFEKAVEEGLLAFLTAENIHVIPGVDRQQAESAARREIETRDLKRMRATVRAALRAALPHLTAQDVPHVARVAWEMGRAMGLADHSGSIVAGRLIRTPNPYAEEADHE